MNLLRQLRTHVPQPVRRWAKRRSRVARLAALLSPYLPPMVCVDVGASYFPHPKWHIFLESPSTQWVAVEPNVANIAYVESWSWPCQVFARPTGLSRDGGERTLYVTPVDSGSSLLEPVIPEGMRRRISNLDYFFPFRKTPIDTATLEQVVADKPPDAPIFVKLDTQGTELDILSGAESLFAGRRIAGIETEATLLAQPIMKGAGKFWEACSYLEQQDLELLHITPIYGPSRFGVEHRNARTYLNECDAVFALRPDVTKALPLAHRAGLLAFYLSYELYEEATSALHDDPELESWLRVGGCPVDELSVTIRNFGKSRLPTRIPR
jgi:FkbM family methyltransferase